jgi:hypothetical protein
MSELDMIMFELGLFGVIILAVAYWAVLWLMGRREDVLHGEYVEGRQQADKPVRSAIKPQPVRPIFPEPPARPAYPARPAVPPPPARAARPQHQTFQPERLQSLLNAIKRDLDPLVPK